MSLIIKYIIFILKKYLEFRIKIFIMNLSVSFFLICFFRIKTPRNH
jgi:hypothetical protein